MMNFDELVMKESPGLCRCCLSEGCYKDLSIEYTWMGDTEVYADMLLECFDIGISQHNEGPNGGNRLICEVCITRLRDACNFKKQVADAEKRFIDMLARGELQPKVIVYQAAGMKGEETLVEEIVGDLADDVEYLDDLYEDDLPLNLLSEVGEPSVSDVTAETLKVKAGKRTRGKKAPAGKKWKLPKLDEKPKTSKSAKAHNDPTAGQWQGQGQGQRLPDEIKDKIIVMWKQNIGMKSIARELKVARNTVKSWIRRYQETGNVYYKRPGPPSVAFTEANVRHREILRLFNEDPYRSTSSMARELNVCHNTVRNHLHKAGLRHYKVEDPNRFGFSVPTFETFNLGRAENQTGISIEKKSQVKPETTTENNQTEISIEKKSPLNPEKTENKDIEISIKTERAENNQTEISIEKKSQLNPVRAEYNEFEISIKKERKLSPERKEV